LADGRHHISRSNRGADHAVSGELGRDRADISRAQCQAETVSTVELDEIATGTAEEILQRTGTCVKIGGFVTIEGTVNGR
jgi:hypothetical protein